MWRQGSARAFERHLSLLSSCIRARSLIPHQRRGSCYSPDSRPCTQLHSYKHLILPQTVIALASNIFVLQHCSITKTMAPTDVVVPIPPTSPRPPETLPGSPSQTPPNSPRVHESPRGNTIGRFEQAVMKLISALEEVEAAANGEDMESKPYQPC